MNHKISKVLAGEENNYILPFFWQHGEEEGVLREYMQAIRSAGIRAVCVESRPHPDFCGPKWWEDMDVILEEAKKYDMKVWILDDSHFPSGYANGALENASPELCRQSVYCRLIKAPDAGKSAYLDIEKLIHPKFKKTMIETIMFMGKPFRKFDDDKLLNVSAYRLDKEGYAPVDLTDYVEGGKLKWKVPEGEWKIGVSCLTRNAGYHRNYINMLDEKSCRILIDTVYEAHYERYSEEFGKTIAGFFSDEPELGNDHLYAMGNKIGSDMDLPWGEELEAELEKRLGKEWKLFIPLLWENSLDLHTTAKVRYAYMDAVTRLVEKNFSFQIGNWCREHKVEYIGHLIEDNNQHCRTGSSLGHFYRGLSGQDMAGIDNIGGQVYPQGEDFANRHALGYINDGEFYHYALGKLGSSYGAIDPAKKGRTMCEIFGNYGWSAGVQLEKYLADHFMVRGVNHFVPHAFSPKAYPDKDCPPHFYAGGNDAQYRHFGSLMGYMNRICELISDGFHIAPAAILYHAEAEWSGECMLMQKPARILADNQIDYDFIPADVFTEKERYKTGLDYGLTVHKQSYKVLMIPRAQYISSELAKSIAALSEKDFPVVFIEALPEGIYDGDNDILEKLKSCPVVELEQLTEFLRKRKIAEIELTPADNRIRYLHYNNGNDMFYFVNEGMNTYKGTVSLPMKGKCYSYHAWDNRLETIETIEAEEGTKVIVELQPKKSLIIMFDEAEEELLSKPLQVKGDRVQLQDKWLRSICRSIDYPDFKDAKEVLLPDYLAKEKPKFSGFVRYENSFYAKEKEKMVLVVSDAAEGVEVFVNKRSAGIQIVPPYCYDITELLQEGENTLSIEVATTLERETAAKKIFKGKVSSLSGITGTVNLYKQP
ncbi:glycosyl hydrolase [Konateibacter massiliensis]|uniref:glycosyl hydrolase n=1 Tax=Konateibacter massiliensis TaxID=2002841 RepID=UPI000C14DA87|nr:glycosyl hydrolase [Konateibacter massiliensis]